MARIENSGIWEQIQKSVKETERLMGQKKYNLSMIQARQTMEFMVKLQCDKAGIVESDSETMIRELYEGKWISKSTAEHYLQILDFGTKASKDGDNSAYNANQAFHFLSQEIYAFVDADKTAKPRRSTAARSAQAVQQAQASEGQARKRQTATSAAASASAENRRQKSSSKNKKSSSGINPQDLIKLLIPIVLVIVLIFLIKVLTPEKDPTNETTPSPATITEQQQTTEEAETEAPVETTADAEPVSYKTTTTLNIRSGPSTESERIGKFDPDKPVEFIRDHDDFWAVILYNGQEAYVAKQYLTPVTE